MFTFSPEPTPSTRRRHTNKSFKYRHTNIFPLDLLDMGQTLGKGAYGKVYKGKLRLNQDLRIEVSKKFWIVTLPQSVTFSQSFEMIPSEKLVGRLRWRRAREAPAPKTWKGRLAFSWNFQRGKLTKKIGDVIKIFRHLNIVNLMGVCLPTEADSHPMLLLELCEVIPSNWELSNKLWIFLIVRETWRSCFRRTGTTFCPQIQNIWR